MMQVSQLSTMARKLIPQVLEPRQTGKIVRFNGELVPVQSKSRAFLKHFKYPKRATRENWIHDGSFHDAVSGLLITAQLFSIMPVCGIGQKDTTKLHFSWKSKRIFYSYAACLGTAFLAVTSTIRFVDRNFNFSRLTGVFFYSYNLYGMYCFIRVAQKWPVLMQKWFNVEQLLPQSSNIIERGKLANKIKLISILVITLSLMEHMLSIVAAVYYTPNCPNIKDPIKMFFKSNFLFVFYYFEYSEIRGFVVKFINVISTFVWSYIDLFVIIVSIGLSHTFRRINNHLMTHKREKMTEQFWGEQRQNYRNICDLVRFVDDAISIITMLSISNNLFFICVSILNSLNTHPTLVHTVYFWFGLAFLIGRTLAVSMCTAAVNDESQRPFEVLRAIPRDGWCVEAKRFAEEVINDTVALTGMKFFNMTRKLVLKVTGSIITYELVLIQFHQDETADYDLCTFRRT